MGKINISFLWGVIFALATWSILYLYWLLNMNGDNIINEAEDKIYYHLPNSDVKNRIKNNDKSIAALEGKSLLYDTPQNNDKYSGNIWKYHRSHSDYQYKMILKQKFAKHLQMEEAVSPDKRLGKCNIL